MLKHRVVYSAATVAARVDELARVIRRDVPDSALLVIGLLTGSFVLVADLVRALARLGLVPLVDFMAVSHYGAATATEGALRILKEPGLRGIAYMLDASRDLPLAVFFMLPSCVPATDLETAGAHLDAGALAALVGHPRVLGLAEMMNYPGVLARDPEVLDKLRLCQGRCVDGHAPGLSGKDLNAYVGAGIRSDHECTSEAEALEKLRAGMHVFIRQGTIAKNLRVLLPLVTGQLVTRQTLVPLTVRSGCAVADPQRDLCKLAVVERHHGTGNVGLGFVRGFGLHAGALASTVAHDSHNLVVVGTNDADMWVAIGAIERMQGGLVAVQGGAVRAAVPLPIAGLMSDRTLQEVVPAVSDLLRASHDLGGRLRDPFMTLSFLALPVIPALRLTDRGLVDVERFRFVSLLGES